MKLTIPDPDKMSKMSADFFSSQKNHNLYIFCGTLESQRKFYPHYILEVLPL